MRKRSPLQLLIILIFSFLLISVTNPEGDLPNPNKTKEKWVDSVMKSLTFKEKIAQLIMLRAYSNKDKEYNDQLAEIINTYHPGGLCFFQGGPVRQAQLTNRYQQLTKTPLFIAIDAEWGLGMRLDSAWSFPYQMTLGAMNNDSIVYMIGSEIGKHCKRMGIHINFAPVADVNNNPNNPVINSRSFGESREEVASNALAYMKGLQDQGIIATAKHFPGHGDTDTDSHHELPVINKSYDQLMETELYPFEILIDSGLKSVMVAHIYLPTLEPTPNTATTLSPNVVTGLLKDTLDFTGLIVTDALDMKGVTKYFEPGDLEATALKAGNDILLLPREPGQAIAGIEYMVVRQAIDSQLIINRCRKILGYKYDAGLSNAEPVDISGLYDDLNSYSNKNLTRKSYESAVTLIKNKFNLIPLRPDENAKIATVGLGSKHLTPFQRMINNYAEVSHFNLGKKAGKQEVVRLLGKLKDFNLVIVSVHNTSIFPQYDFGIKPTEQYFLQNLNPETPAILNLFASPYAIGMMGNIESFNAILISFQDDPIAQEVSAQMIFGAMGTRGKLPVSGSSSYPDGSGINTRPLQILQYSEPEYAGLSSQTLKKIDTLAKEAIEVEATPGCQVLIARKGKIVFQKSYGFHTYQKDHPVKNSDIYDLASITKIAATTLAIMELHEEGKVDIDMPLSEYLPFLRGTDKEDIVIREVMAHQSRLRSWIPFYLKVIEDGQPDSSLFSNKLSEQYPVRVADHFYIRKNYDYVMFDTIMTSELNDNNDYLYSDLGFYFLKVLVEHVTNKPFDEYLNQKFYKPLNLGNTGFLPLHSTDRSQIIPTEFDTLFRKQLVHGDVHDPGAAMLGGISGHAGLFSNSKDLAVIMQMLIQGGHYGGVNFLEPGTIDEFTKQQFPLNENRRAIGFDKPETDPEKNGPACDSASRSSFGHSGFTGTYAWADPDEELVYIFLSNRIHPDASNRKLISENYRTRIQQVIYDAILRE